MAFLKKNLSKNIACDGKEKIGSFEGLSKMDHLVK